MRLVLAFKNYTLKVFDIKEEELKKTLLLQLNLFLIITTLLIVKPTINSLFLSELTSSALPLGYVFTAIAAIIGSYFYNKALEGNPLHRIIEFTQYGSIFSLIAFGIAFKIGIARGLLLYIPYIWVAIFGLLTASQFWILGNLVYNIREAKRVFGFIGAGGIAGGIFGGYITALLTRIVAAEDLFFFAAMLLIPCIFIVRYIWRNQVVPLNTFQVAIRSETKGEDSFHLIKQSKLLSLIAIVIGLSVLVAKLVDYQYSAYASAFIRDPEDLASFFGFWLSTLSVVSLIIQLFFTKKIVGVLGVGRSMLWLPSGILIGSLALLFVPQLWIVIFIKVVDGSLKQSLNKAATELLSIPIPIEVKKKTKTFIDVVVDSIATGVAGLILYFVINGLNLSETYVSLIIIGLISIWIYLIIQLRRAYLDEFKKLFLDGTGKKKTKKNDPPITSIVSSVRRVFLSGSDRQILYMLRKTLEVKDPRFFTDIHLLLKHSSSKVRALAIENLYFIRNENLSSEIEPMIHDQDQRVTTAAFRYLLKYYRGDTLQLFEQYLNSTDLTIRNAALLGLSLELRNHHKLQDRFDLSKKIEKAIIKIDELEQPLEIKNKILIVLAAIGNAKLKNHYSFIQHHLGNPDKEIVRMAIRSASKTLEPQFIETIIEDLSDKELRKAAIQALYDYGEKIIDVLMTQLQLGNIKTEDALVIPKVLEKFKSQKSVKALIQLIDYSEHDIVIKSIQTLGRLKEVNPSLRMKNKRIVTKIMDECSLYQISLGALHSQIIVQYKKRDSHTITSKERHARKQLIKLLETRLDQQLHRIFEFLALKYTPELIRPILDTLKSGKEVQRIHALEFLDNILDIKLKKHLIPLVESLLIDTSSQEQIDKLELDIPSEHLCFTNLLKIEDANLVATVLQLLEHIKDENYTLLLHEHNVINNTTLKNSN